MGAEDPDPVSLCEQRSTSECPRPVMALRSAPGSLLPRRCPGRLRSPTWTRCPGSQRWNQSSSKARCRSDDSSPESSVRGAFPYTANKQRSDGSRGSYNSTRFCHSPPGDGIRSRRLRTQPKTAATSDASCKSTCASDQLPIIWRFQGYPPGG